MNDDACETIVDGAARRRRADIWRQIERFAILDHLTELHARARELKALEVHDEHVGRRVNGEALGGALQRLATLATIGVGAGETLGLAKVTQRRVERGALQLETEIEQWLERVRRAVAARALHSRAKLAAPDALDHSATLDTLGGLQRVHNKT